MVIGWVQLLGLVAGSSVLAALVNQGITIVRERLARRDDAKLSALYLSLLLREYANECASTISDMETYIASEGSAGQPRGNMEPVPAFPDEIDWKALGIGTTQEAMLFRVRVEAARGMITDVHEFGDDDDVVTAVVEQSAKFGLLALATAQAISRDHALPDVKADEDEWSVGDFLRRKAALYEERRERSREAGRKMWEELEGSVPKPSEETDPIAISEDAPSAPPQT
jgi:hypothetical protein